MDRPGQRCKQCQRGPRVCLALAALGPAAGAGMVLMAAGAALHGRGDGVAVLGGLCAPRHHLGGDGAGRGNAPDHRQLF